MAQRITFEDHGQDFLTWTIQDGVVVDCGPFQASVWVGKEARVEGTTAFFRLDDETLAIRYPVVLIEEVEWEPATQSVPGSPDA